MSIEITQVQIFLPKEADKKLKCFANIIFNDVFIVRNLRIIEGSNGFFVVMPNFKKIDGEFKDTAHPLTNEFRKLIEDKVLEAYEAKLNDRKKNNNKELNNENDAETH